MFGLEDEQAAEILRLKKEILRLESELKDEAQRKATLELLWVNLKYEWGEWKRTIENAVHEPDNLVKAIDDVVAALTPKKSWLKPPPSWDTWSEFHQYCETVSSLVDGKGNTDALGTTTQSVPRSGV